MRIAADADMHIGPLTSIQEIMCCFDDMMVSADMIAILGDTLDFKNQTSSENITALLELMDYITPHIQSTGKILRMIYGTQGHDAYPQLQILNPYTARMNFKIISHVTEENIGNTTFLYIPEEIIADKHEYYKDTLYSGKKYDYIFGHGVIAEGFPISREKKRTTKVRTVPTFTTEEIKNATNIVSLWGHYHVHTIMDPKVRYVGSLSRFHHGEPEPKGWYHIDGKKLEFRENQWCPIYTEIKIKCKQYNIEDLHTLISNTIQNWRNEMKDRDKLKFTCFLDRTSPDAISYNEVIKSLCRGEGISYSIKDANPTAVVEDNSEITERYDYIFDRDIPIIDKINKFNDTEFGSDLDQSLLESYLLKVGTDDAVRGLKYHDDTVESFDVL